MTAPQRPLEANRAPDERMPRETASAEQSADAASPNHSQTGERANAPGPTDHASKPADGPIDTTRGANSCTEGTSPFCRIP